MVSHCLDSSTVLECCFKTLGTVFSGWWLLPLWQSWQGEHVPVLHCSLSVSELGVRAWSTERWLAREAGEVEALCDGGSRRRQSQLPKCCFIPMQLDFLVAVRVLLSRFCCSLCPTPQLVQESAGWKQQFPLHQGSQQAAYCLPSASWEDAFRNRTAYLQVAARENRRRIKPVVSSIFPFCLIKLGAKLCTQHLSKCNS